MKVTPIYSGVIGLLFTVSAAFAQPLQLMTYNIRLELKSDGDNQWRREKQ